MTPIQRTQEIQTQPLLTATDIERPLEYGELVDAASILTRAGQDPDDNAQEALGFYRRKEMLRLMGNATFDASRLAERLEKLESRLPQQIEESDLLSKLVHDLAQAREVSTGRGHTMPDIFGLRRRREERERIEALREKAAIDEMIDVRELSVGDTVTFNSELWRNQGKARSILTGEVIGTTDTEIGPAILLRVEREKRSGELEFTTAQRKKGAIARLTGTVFWSNNYRKILQKLHRVML